ncbi:ComF family protein [Paenibacillus sp. Marseille-Q4541]|uniref:ComF family protein n=1 Tax=Paenibacillus sp. Marseille-Q4541 TaxID=2831522 RepID=UPI001BAB21C6|nr:ComF family protein [Paenibacillus sp. Marseille-Q4541]
MNTFERVRSFLEQLAAPPGQICVACGNRAVLSSELPGICRHCVSLVPWVKRIRCYRCGRAVGCPDCVRAENLSRSFELNRSAVLYDSLMREWLAVYKYRGKERIAPLLGAILNVAYVALQREMTLLGNSSQKVRSLVPNRRIELNRSNAWLTSRSYSRGIWHAQAVTFVPVSQERYMERGFNQAERLAEVLSSHQRLPLIPMLKRTQHTEKQSYKSRKERVETMRNVFAIHPFASEYFNEVMADPSYISNRNPIHLILVDDVYTTGSTLEACSRVIKEWGRAHGIHFMIYSLTWARS